jgi:hypothetical protein
MATTTQETAMYPITCQSNITRLEQEQTAGVSQMSDFGT